MNVVQRVQDMLLKPKETWPIVEAEAADTASIYTNYVMLLAAIPAVAAFIGLSLIGVGAFGFSYRVPLLSGLVHMVVSYAMSLAAVFLLALIADALAPQFGGTKNATNALKLIAYGCTAGFVGGVAQIIPALGILGLVAVAYSIYLIYLGAPVLMKTPPEKTGGYTAVVMVCALVAFIVFGALASIVLPGRGWGGMGGHMGSISINGPQGKIDIDTSKMEEAARRAEEASKQLEAAQKSGDSAAAGKAMGEMLGAITGGAAGGAPIAAPELKALLPESLAGLKRSSIESVSNQMMGFNGSTANAAYGEGDKRLSVSITDLGNVAGLAAVAGWASATMDRESATEVERVYKQGNRTIKEQWQKDGSQAEYTVIIENGVVIEGRGDQLDIGKVKAAINSLDLGRIESLKRAAKS